MTEQKQLEVILRVFMGEKRSYEVGVSLEVSGLQFQSRLVLNVALISAVDGEYQGQGPLEIIS
jgi:hypothetical protein